MKRRVGIAWNEAITARRHLPTGLAHGTVVLRDATHLVWAGLAANPDNGYLMEKQLGDTTVLQCP